MTNTETLLTRLLSVQNETDLVKLLRDGYFDVPPDMILFLYIETEWMEIVTFHGKFAPIQTGTHYHLPDYMSAMLWTNQPLYIGDVFQDPRMDDETRHLYHNLNIRSSAMLPLRKSDGWLGAIAFSWRNVRAFPKSEDGVYNTLLNLLPPVVEKCRLISQLKRQVEEARIMETALRESEARFQAFINNSPALAFIADINGVIVYANPMFQQLIRPDIPLQRLIGMNNVEIFGEELAAEYQRNNEKVLQTGQIMVTVENFRYPDRTQAQALLYKFPVGDSLIGGVGIDITDQKKAEDVLREQRQLELELEKERELRRAKDYFMTMISHEFRTPLAIINTSSDILRRYFNRLNEGQRQLRLNHIQEQVYHLQSMLDEIQLLIQLESNYNEFEPENCNLGEFCSEFIANIQESIGQRHRLSVETGDNLPSVPVDKRLLRHILNNLLSNAIKYSAVDSKIHITLVYDQNTIVITVRDQGIGISPHDLKNIWQPFFRGSNVGSISGTGIGLKIVKECVTLHKGTIEVKSEAGKGTVFTLRLPVKLK